MIPVGNMDSHGLELGERKDAMAWISESIGKEMDNRKHESEIFDCI